MMPNMIPPLRVRRALQPTETTLTFQRTFDYWGAGYEDTAEDWVKRKETYNREFGLDVWVLVQDNNGSSNENDHSQSEKKEDEEILAHAELQSGLEGYFNEKDGGVRRGKVVSICGLFVPENYRGKGYVF
jgi:hypothetical protein